MEQKFQFIAPEAEIDGKVKQPASYLRRAFVVKKPVRRALLHMTALGSYIGYFNGTRLDGHELLPGYTDYKFRLQYQTYDVTARLADGENVIGAIVGDGWYRGCLGIGSHRNLYGEKTALCCLLELDYEDGSAETISTDTSWRATQEGPLRENDLKTLERYDARKEMRGWCAAGFDDSVWHGVADAAYAGALIAHEGEFVANREHFSATVLHTPDGGTVLDFEQNMAGRVTFTVQGPAGHAVALTMGETLDENGNFTQKNLIAEGAGASRGSWGNGWNIRCGRGGRATRHNISSVGFGMPNLKTGPRRYAQRTFAPMRFMRV